MSARVIHKCLLRPPILSRGCPLLGAPVRLCRPHLREAHDPLHLGEQEVPRFGLSRLATASMNNPSWRGGRSGPVALLVLLAAAARARVVPPDFFARSTPGLVAVPDTSVLAAVQFQLRR